MLKVRGITPQTITFNNKDVNQLSVMKNNVKTIVWQKTSDVARFGSAVFGSATYY